MNRTLENRKISLLLLIVCFIAYTVVAFTRNAYTAAIAGVVADGVFSKTDAGTINSSFYLTYSLAQILGSYFVDKISPFKILSFGMIGTMLANIAMSFSASFAVIFIARAFSGIVQFGVWPALLKIVSEYVHKDCRRKAMYIMPLGVTAGTILSFLIASIVLNHGSWQDLFTISYVLLGVMFVVFVITVRYSESKAVQQQPEAAPVAVQEIDKTKPEIETISVRKLMLSSGAVFICFASFIKSIIASGISSWMPTMIMESYEVSPGFSSALTAISTCSNLAAVVWVMWLYPKVFKDQTVAVGMFFVLSVVPMAVLAFIGKIPLLLVVVLITLVNMFKNAIHQFLTVEIPAAYTKFNKSGMMAGVFNAFACIGSMISGTFNGFLADTFCWNITVALWGGLALLGVLVSFIASPIWKKFTKANGIIRV